MDHDPEIDGSNTDRDWSDVAGDDAEPDSPTENAGPTRPPTARNMLGGAMLGVGAIFNPNNVGPDSHWSQSPKVVLEVETRAEANGLDLDDSNVPATPPRELTPRPRRWAWFRRRA